MNLFTILLLIVTLFLLLIKLIASLTGRVTERLLTRNFRDLEALLEHDQLPAGWIQHLKTMAQGDRMRRRFGYLPFVEQLSWEEAAKPLLIKKIRTLRDFFADSPFVESPETRALLLEQLEAMTKRWEDSDLAEILAYYDLTIDMIQ